MEPRILRKIRKSLTFNLLLVGLAISRKAATPRTIEFLRKFITLIVRTSLPRQLRLRKNMICAGMYRRELLNAHFDRALDQLAILGHVAHAGFPGSKMADKFVFDDTLDIVKQAYAEGKGVLVISPHICCYPIFPRVLDDYVPTSIYLRRNKDPRKEKVDSTIGLLGDGRLVSPPAGASKAERLQVAIDELRQGRCLFITPDTPRKPDDGVPVELFGKKVWYPTGPYVMSLRTGSPVIPAWWYWQPDDGKYHVYFSQPLGLRRGAKLREQTEMITIQWARMVDEFLHKHPEMWWNWLDKRWTYILRGVWKYSQQAQLQFNKDESGDQMELQQA